MQRTPFAVREVRPLREGMTVSRPAFGTGHSGVTWFSLAAGTSITPETYDTGSLCVVDEGTGILVSGNFWCNAKAGDILFTPPRCLCGVMQSSGLIYTEIVLTKESAVTPLLKAGAATQLKDLIDYEEESIANLDLAHNAGMKYVLMAFDEGTGLTPHRAPGNAIVTILEGKARIGYEGVDHELTAGQSFRFDKNGLHSVTALGRMKMSLLIVLD